MTAVLFVIILVVVSGLVAAAGDRMGHRAARAKIRIGKLRPRTASTIIAVSTGIVISLLTFGVVFASWADFRDALLHFERIKQDLAEKIEAYNEQDALLKQTQQAKASLDAELAAKQQELTTAATNLAQTKTRLAAATAAKTKMEREVSQLTASVASLNKQKALEAFNVQSLTGVKDKLRDDIGGLETKMTSYQQGKVVLPRGHYLAYQVVHPGDAANLASILDGTLKRVTVNLSKQNLGVEQESEATAKSFISDYAYASASTDVVIIISVAKNTFEGEGVALAFEARPLDRLVKSGDVILSVIVEQGQARASALGQAAESITIPAQFDVDSLADFSVKLENLFQRSAEQAGFLPSLGSGSVASPVIALADVSDDLISRARPFVIQFVAQQDCTALGDLATSEVYISTPPAAP